MSASLSSGTYPRASASAPAFSGLRRAAHAFWFWAQRVGAHRAQPELMRMAQIHEQRNPELAQNLRKAARSLLQG